MKYTVFYDQIEIDRTSYQVEAETEEDAEAKADKLYRRHFEIPSSCLLVGWISESDVVRIKALSQTVLIDKKEWKIMNSTINTKKEELQKQLDELISYALSEACSLQESVSLAPKIRELEEQIEAIKLYPNSPDLVRQVAKRRRNK